jgi:glycosyltransferase involved in cell wall biosynthesis
LQALIIHHAPPKSGIGMYALNLYRYLKNEDVTLVDISDPKQLGLASNQIHKFKRAFELGKGILTLPKGYDVYHASSQIISVCCPLTKPMVLTIHDIESFLGSGDRLMNFVFKINFSFATQAEAVICPSEFSSRQVRSKLKIDERKIHVIPHGVDHRLFQPRDRVLCRRIMNLPEDAKLIISNSTTLKHKNIPTLLRAFRIILEREPNARLIRIGAPNPCSPELARLAKKLGIADFIIYAKPSHEELAYLYNAADIFVHTSTYEGFGEPVAEAMASGIPVVTSKAASVPEVVENAGIMLEPFDIEGFVSEIIRVLQDKKLAANLSDKGIARSQIFSWERCADQTLKVYRSVTEQNRK